MFFQGTCHPADGSACSHSGNKHIYFSVCIRPDFFTCSECMNLCVRRIFKLLKDDRTGNRRPQLLRFCNGPCHTGQSICQYNFSTQCFQQIAALYTHGFGHREHQVISFDCSNHRQSHTGISTGRLYNRRTGLQCSARFRIFDHGKRHTILHTPSRIERFQLCDNILFQSVFTTVFR